MRSGSRHRGEAGGGWLFGFPPLLATDGRIHKGDCDMRTGAIFARGSCRALKWMALLGVVFMLGAGQAAAQASMAHAVVDDANASVVNVLLMGAVTIAAPAAEVVGPPAVPAGKALNDAFTMTGYTVAATAATATAGVTGPSSSYTHAGYTVVAVTFTTPVTGLPTLVYTKPGVRDGRLQIGGSQDVESFSHVVRPAQPVLPIIADITVQKDATVRQSLPPVSSGGMLPIWYQIETIDATPAEITGNIMGGTAAAPTDSGLRFDRNAGSIVGIARDIGTYTFNYRARSGDGLGATGPADAAPTQVRTVKINVVAVPTVTPGVNDGIITSITVDGAAERTIDGVIRAHIDEGTLTTVSVTVEWNHADVTALWAGHTAASPPEPATVQIMVRPETDARSIEWISPAETNEMPGLGTLGGDDAVLATNTVSIAIPAKPTATQYPNDTSRFRTSTGKVSLSLPLDQDAEDEGFRVHVVAGTGSDVSTNAPRGRTMTDRMIVIEDIHVQGVKLSRDPASTAAIFEGGSVTFKAVADPPREDLDLQVRYNVTVDDGVSVSSRLYTLDSSIGVIPVGTGPMAKDQVKFTSPKNDGDRMDNEFTIHAEVVSFDLTSGAYDDIEASSVDFTVLDLHKLPPLTVTPMEGKVAEGESTMLTLAVDRNPATTRRVTGEKVDVTKEALTVTLSMGAGSTASASDYQIITNPISIPEYKTGATVQEVLVEVMAVADNQLDDMEMLVLDAEVNGTVAASGPNSADDSYAAAAMLTIEESTTRLVFAKSEAEVQAAIYAARDAGAGDDMTFTAGEMIEIMGSALFSHAEGVTLSYSVMSSDGDVASTSVSGGTVMVTAGNMGMADITITAHASMPSGVTIVDQTDPREASIMFPVEVGLEALSIMLSGPEEMNLAEGMSAEVKATANRDVTADTMVMLMRDRSMSSADDDDFTVAAITIKAGDDVGSTMVMAVEDNMAEDMEELVLYGMTEGMAGEVTGEVKLYIWDAAVPALPIIAQLLLAAFLAIGGYRRYLRR